MSDSTILEADAAETKFRAEWLHKHKAHKDWIILSVSEVAVIRDELLAVKRERDELKALLTKEQGAVTISRNGYVQELERQRDEALSWEAMYQKVVAACLRCDPIPACQREDGQLEPPWEVIDRIRCELDEARGLEAMYQKVDMQAVGKLLGVRLGESITSNIEPQIRELIKQRDKLAEALRKCREDSVCEQVRMEKCGYTSAANESQANIDRADEALQSLNPNASVEAREKQP